MHVCLKVRRFSLKLNLPVFKSAFLAAFNLFIVSLQLLLPLLNPFFNRFEERIDELECFGLVVFHVLLVKNRVLDLLKVLLEDLRNPLLHFESFLLQLLVIVPVLEFGHIGYLKINLKTWYTYKSPSRIGWCLHCTFYRTPRGRRRRPASWCQLCRGRKFSIFGSGTRCRVYLS